MSARLIEQHGDWMPCTRDGRCHLTPANLITMLHRAQEWQDTKAQLDIAFGDTQHFAVHDAVPPAFGDEGAANHMRLCESHGEPGVEVFVYGRPGGKFPARQHEQLPESDHLLPAREMIDMTARSDRRLLGLLALLA